MKLIVIGPPFPFEGETKLINEMFALGMDYHHLRSPFIDVPTQLKFMKKISAEFRNRVIIHQHYETLDESKAGGIHLKEVNRKSFEEGSANMKVWRERREADADFHISTSFHELDDLASSTYPYTYGFISPIFESISKDNYASTFSLAALKRGISLAKCPVIGLGGMRPNNLETVKSLGVVGFASLGYIWKSENQIESFKKIKAACAAISPAS